MGGKWRIAPWIIAHLPPHRIYVEPFGGAGSVLVRKQRSFAEVYNDLDGQVVGLFRILRNRRQASQLIRAIALTPFARAEFELAYEELTGDPIEDARRLVARSFMGHGSSAVARRRRTGFRGDCNRSGTTPAHDWGNLPQGLAAIVARLQGVVIENRPASAVFQRYDGKETLFYVAPPYLHATRSQKSIGGQIYHSYDHEMGDAEHIALLDQLRDLSSMVVLSGYSHALYEERLADWHRVTLDTYADGAKPRSENLWINPAAFASRRTLFSSLGPEQ
jgi:DNA adenine methylase